MSCFKNGYEGLFLFVVSIITVFHIYTYTHTYMFINCHNGMPEVVSLVVKSFSLEINDGRCLEDCFQMANRGHR